MQEQPKGTPADVLNIVVNGDALQVPVAITASELVQMLNVAELRIAMELNRRLVPRSAFHWQRFEEGDRVEIVHAIGGG